MLLCRNHSRLHRRAAALNLPALTTGGPLDLPRLWFWQRRHKFLLVQTMGENAMALGRCVLRMRAPQTTLLAHAFLLRPPHEDVCTGKPMRCCAFSQQGWAISRLSAPRGVSFTIFFRESSGACVWRWSALPSWY